MWPFSYSRCAVDIVYFAEKPSFRDASCCSVVVRNGAYGARRYGLRSTLATANAAPSRRLASAPALSPSRTSGTPFRSAPFPVAARRVPSGVKSRPCAILRPSSADNRAGKEEGSSWACVLPRSAAGAPERPAFAGTVVKTASRSQYSAGRNAMRSRSLATTRRVATD